MRIDSKKLIVPVAVGLTLASPAWASDVQVPEPNILALFGVGGIAAILIARYRRKK